MNDELIVKPMTEISDAERLKQIAGEVATLMATLQNLRIMACSTAISIGRLLTEAKSRVKHGEWLPYMESLGMKSSMADNYMKLFREYGANQVSLFGDANSQTIGNLPVSKALALLSAPESSRDALAEQAEEMSVRELKEAIKAEKEKAAQAEKRAEEAQNRADAYRMKDEAKADTLERMKAEQEKLKADLKAAQEAPKDLTVETVAVVDEDAVREAVEAEKKKAAAELEKQNTQAQILIDKQAAELAKMKNQAEEADASAKEAQKKLKAAEEELSKAKSAGADGQKELQDQIEQLRAERDEAQKKADAAGRSQAMIEINTIFKGLQTDVTRLKGLLDNLDDVSRARIKNAMKQVFAPVIE